MKIGIKLLIILTIVGLVLTFLLSWSIEYNKYRKKLVDPNEISKTLSYFELIVTEAYPKSAESDDKEKNFLEAVERVKGTLSKKISAIDAFKMVQPVLSTLEDQHTRFYPPYDPNYKVLPFSTVVIDKRIIVTSTANEKVPAGAEVLEIDGKNAEELIDSLVVYTCGENYELREQQIGDLIQLLPEIFRNPRRPKVEVFYRPESHTVTLKNGEKTEKVNVETVSIFSYPTLSSSYDALPSILPFEYQQNGEVGILKFGTFSLSGTMYNKYREFLTQKFLEMKDTHNLLIDLRGCTISDFTIFKELFEHLISEPMTTQRKVSVILTAYNLSTLEKYGIEYNTSTNNLVTVEYSQKFKPRTLSFNGKLWILIDRYTSDAALDFAYMMMNIEKAKIVGEPTLTPINHTTDVVYQYSDGIKMTYSYPKARFSDKEDNSTLVPNYLVNVSTEDRIAYTKGTRDIMLDEALAVIRNSEEN